MMREKTAEQLEKKAKLCEEIIDRYLPAHKGYYAVLTDAMRYSVNAGGKRIRPVIMMETCKIFGGAPSAVLEPFVAAIEMIHTYSLIHDDLPAMDNDDYRRGRKTTHKVYGEAIAILAGDGLLNLAYEVASSAFDAGTYTDRIIKAL
ncbi:MAG: polyprenyl synthetase family protein, partial [Lachnospiraceae bacterium]|nr:polyprenyl synthetase family protein [Lachnospiraceae bacterium]